MVGILQEGDVCNGENVGLLRYNTTRRMLLFCDGQNWKVCVQYGACMRGAFVPLCNLSNAVLFLHKVRNSGEQLSTTGRRDSREVELQHMSCRMPLALLCTCTLTVHYVTVIVQ